MFCGLNLGLLRFGVSQTDLALVQVASCESQEMLEEYFRQQLEEIHHVLGSVSKCLSIHFFWNRGLKQAVCTCEYNFVLTRFELPRRNAWRRSVYTMTICVTPMPWEVQADVQ